MGGNRQAPAPHLVTVSVVDSRPKGTTHLISQGQIDSYTARVLAMEQSLGTPESRSESRAEARLAGRTISRAETRAEMRVEPRIEKPRVLDCDCSYLKCEQPRTRSPSVPNTLTLGDYSDDTSPSGSRKGLSPLLELRRPHCTLNCENCRVILEERSRHSRCPQFLVYFSVVFHGKFAVKNHYV